VTRDAIIDAVRAGRVVWPGHPPTPIPHDDSFTAYDASKHEGLRIAVHADVIREALLELAADDQRRWDPRGVRIRDTTVIGTLDLNWCTLPFPVGFEGCEFDEWIWADHLEVPQLVFDGCRFSSFGGTGIRIPGRLLFFECRDVTQVFLPDSRVGIFELREESFDDPAAIRLVLTGAHFDELVFDYHATLHGGVEQFTGLSDILPSDGFDDVEVDRIRTPPLPVRRRTVGSTVRGWLLGGEKTRPAEYLSAWLAGDASVPARRPGLAERTKRSWRRGAPREDRRFVAQTWQRFADALDRAGMGEDARELRIEAERHRSRTQNGRLRQLGSALLFDLPIRYGYRNSRVGWLLMVLFLLATAVVYANRSAFVATADLSNDSRYPGLWPLAYALDVVVSPVGTGQADGWWTGSSGGVAAALIVIKLLSWLLGAVFVTGVSRVLTRSAGQA
jgi:hypothetical protein